MELTSTADLVMYRYKIEISQNQLNGRSNKARDKKRVIQLLLEANFPGAGAHITSDFAHNLITTKKLNIPPQRFKVTFRTEDEDTQVQMLVVTTSSLFWKTPLLCHSSSTT